RPIATELRQQYATADNLEARIALHQRFSISPHWQQWLFAKEAPLGRPARILHLGCGSALLWRTNRDRIDPRWQLTLADVSPGMIEAARHQLGDRAHYNIAEAESLPFPDGSFDVVLANHMLYHVQDRPRSLAEIRRVLTPEGVLHAATNGLGHLAELWALVSG